MQFFTAPCEVVEGDLAGCGPRLFLTGTRVLGGVWDRLIGEARSAAPDSANEVDSVAWIVREQGLRALAPVAPHERLGVLLSLERLADRATFRLDYRIVRDTGEPVACAFMVIGCTNKATGTGAPLPRAVVDFIARGGGYEEPESSPSFIERALVLPDAAETLFPDEVRALGAWVATQVARPATRRHTPTTPLSIPALGELVVPDGRTAFFFPDIDSYDGKLVCELRAYLPYLADYFDQAEEVARRVFRHSFLPLVDSDTLALHDQRLERCPELAHIGVVLTGVLLAESLKEHGIQPHALIGDGLGELAACAVAGATELSTALRLAALRAIATRPSNGNGDGSAAEQFAATLADVRFEQPQLPIVSLRTHGLLTPNGASGWLPLGTSAAVFDVVSAAWAAGCEHVIECGPRGVLSVAARVPASALQFAADARDARA
jgi:hypothetical protein